METLRNLTLRGPLRNLLRAWLVQVVGRYAEISQQSPGAALDDVKSVAATLSEADLGAIDSE